MKLADLLETREEFLAKERGQALLKASENDLQARFIADPLELVQRLAEMDPTKGKMLGFLVNKYAKGEFKLEDKERVMNALTQFERIKNTLQNKDINQFKTMHDLYQATETPVQVTIEPSKRQHEKQIKHEGATVVLKGPGIQILHLKTPEAACFYASGTRWCTTNKETFLQYVEEGDIYLIIIKLPPNLSYKNQATGEITTTRKFQFHYETGQMMNEQDAALSQKEIALLSNYPEWYQFIDMMVRRHHQKLPQK